VGLFRDVRLWQAAPTLAPVDLSRVRRCRHDGTEFLVPLAEIAGVFVGFGALIAVRSGGPTDPREVAYMRGVVSFGMLTIVAAFAPGVFGRFDLTEHAVWSLSSAVTLVGWSFVVVASLRTPEYRQTWAGELAEQRAGARSRWVALADRAGSFLFMALLAVTPIIVIVGVVPELEAALYYAYVALLLLGAGGTLRGLVFAQRRPAAA
jgi:hypothetical protein